MTNNIWAWIDGSPVVFTNWDHAQPQNTSGANCGAVVMQGGKWIADDCFKQKPFVCSIKASIPTTPLPITTTTTASTTTTKPKSCEAYWSLFDKTGYCYMVYHAQNWGGANAWCSSKGANLASFHSAAEAQFIASMVSKIV